MQSSGTSIHPSYNKSEAMYKRTIQSSRKIGEAALEALAAKVKADTNGVLVFNPDGSFTYTPAAGYAGPDSFTYRASDGIAASAAATVTITVLPRQVTVFSDAAGGALQASLVPRLNVIRIQ